MAEPMGFFTDTTVCIGCKACEVACKQWNQLPRSTTIVGRFRATATTTRAGSTARTGVT
jgi:Fe-S-cluster-containing dehydrogenase component